MRQESIDPDRLFYAPCHYGASRILFRGPRKTLHRPYIAFIGGTETYGKFIEKPFPALVEAETRRICVNLGCVNGGIDAFVNDPTVMGICQAANMTIVQVMGANHLSNRLYAVHPRRNDRFLHASGLLQRIYPEVDFTEFTFTRHLMGRLYAVSPVRFGIVVHELRQAWTARMLCLLSRIGPHCMLLWFSEQPLTDADWFDGPRHLQADPLFITASMIDRLRPFVRSVVVVNPSSEALAQGTAGMRVSVSQANVAAQMLGVSCHAEAAAALISALRAL